MAEVNYDVVTAAGMPLLTTRGVLPSTGDWLVTVRAGFRKKYKIMSVMHVSCVDENKVWLTTPTVVVMEVGV